MQDNFSDVGVPLARRYFLEIQLGVLAVVHGAPVAQVEQVGVGHTRNQLQVLALLDRVEDLLAKPVHFLRLSRLGHALLRLCFASGARLPLGNLFEQ